MRLSIPLFARSHRMGRAVAAAREDAEGKLSPVSAEVAANCVPAFLARLWHKSCHLSTAQAGNGSVTQGLTAKNAACPRSRAGPIPLALVSRLSRPRLGGESTARENAERKLSPGSAGVAANRVPAFLARLWHKSCHLSTAQAGEFRLTTVKRMTRLASAGEIPRFRGTGDSAIGGRGIAGWVATEIRPGESFLAPAIAQATAPSLFCRMSGASVMAHETQGFCICASSSTVKGRCPINAEPTHLYHLGLSFVSSVLEGIRKHPG